MDDLLKEMLNAAGISGCEKEIAAVMTRELKKSCAAVSTDIFGNVIGIKRAEAKKSPKKIMLAAHMDEIGLAVKYIEKDGYVRFIKVGGIDDRILPGQRVVIKGKTADIPGIIGAKPPHLQKEEERKQPLKYDDLFIDTGCRSREETERLVQIGGQIVFEANAGTLRGSLRFGKAVDDRIGCYALLKVMEKLHVNAEVYAVATVQEEVGLKGARTSAFKINPDLAIVLETAAAGDTPQTKEADSPLKLGAGTAITIIEAGGRGLIVHESVKNLFIRTARRHKIRFQAAVVEGGMTDGAVIHMTREGILCGVLAVPTRYVHSPSAVFSRDDVNSMILLAVKSVEEFVRSARNG